MVEHVGEGPPCCLRFDLNETVHLLSASRRESKYRRVSLRCVGVSWACCWAVAGHKMHLVSLSVLCDRDILEVNLGVRWDDIAGLQDAKQVLQENCVLPLLMPDFFQGIRRPVKASVVVMLCYVTSPECSTRALAAPRVISTMQAV